MQFANQALSLFISGIFCLVWLLILSLPFLKSFIQGLQGKSIDPVLEKIMTSGFSSAFLSILFAFVIFPLAYTLGTIINTASNKLFKKLKASFQEKDTNYDLMRYQIYLESSDLYSYINFHYEIIRILRANSFNFLMIYISLALASLYQNHDVLFFLGYIIAGLILLLLILTETDVSVFIFSPPAILILFGLPVFSGVCLKLYPFGFPFFSYLLPSIILVSYGSFLVWKSKLKSFYKMVKDTDIMIKKRL